MSRYVVITYGNFGSPTGASGFALSFQYLRTGLDCCLYRGLCTGDSAGSYCVGSGPSTRPVGTYSHPTPSAFMMNGCVPDSASSPIAPGFAAAEGGLLPAKSGTS